MLIFNQVNFKAILKQILSQKISDFSIFSNHDIIKL